MATWFKGDCLERMKRMESRSINLILWDPPFATTRNKWDEPLDWPAIFRECFRILKEDGMLVIHASVPFNYTLIRAAPKPPSYSWYWLKENSTNPLLANTQPLRNTEEILVWKNERNTYYRQYTNNIERVIHYKAGNAKGYYGDSTGGVRVLKGKLQTHHIQMKRKIDGFSTRPDELIELMIKSYTKEGDTVLDPTCYKGVSGAISKRLGRKWVGIDKHFFPVLLLNGNSGGP